MDERGTRISRTSGMIPWRAGCGESRTSGSEGGPRRRTGREAGTAPRSDPYTHFTRAKVAVTVVEDLISRKWLAEIVSAEETSTQIEIVFTDALAAEGILACVEARADGLVDPKVDDEARPVLLAVSDNGPQMTSGSNREFMALCAIAQPARALGPCRTVRCHVHEEGRGRTCRPSPGGGRRRYRGRRYAAFPATAARVDRASCR